MGWTVLHVAFGIVALWLLGEVLLQYKARLRWRLLAFVGFLTVVLGVVVLSSVVVIALGAAAFAVGQTFVTLSYRRGFSTGWALGGMPGSSRRRREGAGVREDDADQEPPGAEGEEDVFDGTEAGHADAAFPHHGGAEAPSPYPPHTPQPPTYEPQPLPDDTSEYGVYDREDRSPFEPAAYHDPSVDLAAGYATADPGYAGHTGDPGYAGHTGHADTRYGTDGHGSGYGFAPTEPAPAPYASHGFDAYPDPSHSTGSGYDPYGAAVHGGSDGYGQVYDAAGAGYDSYGGAWVPQQRDAGGQPYAYQDVYGGGTGSGYDYPTGTGGAAGYVDPYAQSAYQQPGYGYGTETQGYDQAGGDYGYTYEEQRGYDPQRGY